MGPGAGGGAAQLYVVQPTIENCYKMSRFFEVPIEYFIMGQKASQDFRDAELLALFHEVDQFDRKDRDVVKGYIRKYLAAKKKLSELIEESKGLPGGGRKKETGKRKKAQKKS